MVKGVRFTTVNVLTPSKFSDMRVLVPEGTNKLLEPPRQMLAGLAFTDVIAVVPLMVTVFDEITAAQFPLPLAVKVRITLPAAISAAPGV